MSEDYRNHVYKYVSPNNIAHIFSDPEKATVKFSLPADFNDPFELFLTIDFNRDPDELAFYLDLISDGLQFPTTCFSTSPIVVPMWAHYAQNSQGFVIEFSEAKLREAFPDARFGNVSYSDVPKRDLSELLMRAHQIKKFRYVMWLRQAIFDSAYFTKTLCWSYELERRMIVEHEATRVAGDMMLLDIPREAVSAIICGPRASPETAASLNQIATDIGCNFFSLRMGKSSATPYMVDQRGMPFVAGNDEIREAEFQCKECREPTSEGVHRCSWCEIDDDTRQRAAGNNSFRLLQHLGLLEDYIRDFR
ncbi:DUF2971 domain-containing protein [Rhizobium laguerreae]|uniref:DUF2971 domain-containing protein n=1 Tax=Rhizobium laguerreae TaxID=1076926 RepID=UPI001441C4A7|nr:DUF2971 domain-containing protein [Rhizobium laguerreae]NKN15515.1 DUF2971 domain-containing protein [Rhizobium laguerreae]